MSLYFEELARAFTYSVKLLRLRTGANLPQLGHWGILTFRVRFSEVKRNWNFFSRPVKLNRYVRLSAERDALLVLFLTCTFWHE